MSPLRGAPQALNPDNPFPGLLPFEERDAGFFFGRDAEKADLFERVRRETLTVLFGRSGLGKTSLLRAGVFPMFREAGLLPIPVRLDLSERGGALGAQVQAAIVEVIEAQAVEAPAPGAEQSLWEYFHATHFWGAGNRLLTPVLVIDQFEELFTLGQGDGRIGPFITELADLIENYIPASVRARIEASGEPLAFDYDQQNYRVVVSLREDYLPRSRSPARAHPCPRPQPREARAPRRPQRLGGDREARPRSGELGGRGPHRALCRGGARHRA